MLSNELHRITEEDLEALELPFVGPERRIELMCRGDGTLIRRVALDLNRLLLPSRLGIERTGKLVYSGSRDVPMIEHVGLHFTRDLDIVLPHLACLGMEILGANEPLDVKRQRWGDGVGAMIGAGQVFVGGNKRTARAAGPGYAARGKAGILPAYYGWANFEPSYEVEETILLQNMMRIVKGGPDTDPGIARTDRRDVSVVGEARDLLRGGQRRVDRLRFSFGEPGGSSGITPADWNLMHLESWLARTVANQKLRQEAACVLMQRYYGPAAYVLAIDGADLSKLDEQQATALVNVNRKLLVMRVLSLVAGLADGGVYWSVPDRSHPEVEPRMTDLSWRPRVKPDV